MRFRIQAPNSLPRAIRVIGLDRAGDAAVRELAARGWMHTTFFPAVSPEGVLTDVSGRTTTVTHEVDAADLVVLVAGPGGGAHGAAIVGRACSDRRVMTTGFLVGAASAADREVAKTLAQLRPWSLMLVIARSDDYLDDMMTALRA
jgi:hypothetical protein